MKTNHTPTSGAAPVPEAPKLYTQADLDAAVAAERAKQERPKAAKASPPIEAYMGMLGRGARLEEIAKSHGKTTAAVHKALKARGLPTCARKYLEYKALADERLAADCK